MAPQEFNLRLQHGITGGFAPPTPSAIYAFTKSAPQTNIFIESAVRPLGTPQLQSAVAKSLSFTDNDNDKDSLKLVDELHGILKILPTEQPPGSEDIYGLDTSIAWESEDLQWLNGGPQGCGGGISEVQASAEQKAKFKRAVDIVNELFQKAH